MKLKFALAASTALALMTGIAMAGSNDAISNQTGNDNSTDIFQSSTSGQGHKANSDVTGNKNTISIDQDSAASAHGNASVLVNGAGGNGDRNEVSLTQSKFAQTGENQDANVDIYGDRNIVNGRQEYGLDNERNKLKVIIRGDNEGSGNTVDVYQSGNGETSTTTIWGDSNDVDVSQGSGHNTATIYIDANSDDGEGDFNKVNVKQDHGTASWGIAGTPTNTANITIYGDRNNTSGGFSGDAAGLAGTSSLNPGDIVQSGTANLVTLNVGGLSDSNRNAFAVKQVGVFNTLTGNVLGNRNQLVAVQGGEGNTADLYQLGDSNNAAISQTNNSNTSTVQQIGNSNAITVTQQ